MLMGKKQMSQENPLPPLLPQDHPRTTRKEEPRQDCGGAGSRDGSSQEIRARVGVPLVIRLERLVPEN